MKKSTIMLLFIFILSVFLPPLISFQGDSIQKDEDLKKKIDKYLKEWLDSYIQYIITDEEKNAFKLKKKLKDRDEQLRYIEFFWRRRDPTPNTPQNEFQQEIFKRVRHANKFYMIGKKEGWESQRGQIFIVFGPPSETQKGTMTETWLYYSLPTDRIPSNFSILFKDIRGNNDYRVANTMYPGKDAGEQYMDSLTQRSLSSTLPREIFEGIKDINKKSIVNKELKLEDIPPPPKEQTENRTALPPRPSGEAKPKEAPFDLQQIFFQSEDDNIEMLLGFSFNVEDVNFKEEDGKSKSQLKIRASLFNQDKQPVDSFEKEFSYLLDPEDIETRKDEKLYFWNTLKTSPGPYFIQIESQDMNSNIQSVLSSQINIPVLKGNDLYLSNIIPAHEIKPLSPDMALQEHSPDCFHILGFEIYPNLKTKFKSSSNFCAFFQVLNLKGDEQTGKPQVDINLHVFTSQKNHFKSFKFSEVDITSHMPGEITAASCFPLAGFPQGDYFFIIQVKDLLANKETAARLNVSVIKDK